MTKFIEVLLDGKTQSINVDNIALLKSVDTNSTEIHLLTKDEKGNQISFRVPLNYGKLRFILIQEGRLSDSPAINTTK
jgi:hypothetical protein